MVTICTDSCADLSVDLLDKYRIKVIPLQVLVAGRNIKDGDMTLEELFSSVVKTGQLPKTSAPSVADFVEFFSGNDEVVYIGISEKLSATLQSAQLAVQELKEQKIFIVDSKNLSTGIGLLALKATDLRDEGLEVEKIADELKGMTDIVRTSFVIDTMEYLYKGGRCSGLQALAGSLLQIRPVITVQKDGTLGVKHKIRGTRAKALNTLLEDFKADLPGVDMQRVFVTHTDCPEDANFLVEELQKLAPIEQILITTAGATIASHCGPKTIGILYMKA
jgi:DegV family protein with EDD domain